MTKDNFTFAVVGILLGFIGGYMMHEVMVARQPPRLTPELRAQIVADPNAGGGAMQGAAPQGDPAAGPAAGNGPAMAEVQQLQAALEQNPNDADVIRRLADLNFDIQNWPRAQQLYVRYLELRPGDPNVMTDLGISFRESKQYDQALEQFDKAQAIDPQHWQAYYNEVVVLAFDLKRFDEADRSLAKLQELQPGNPNVARLAEAVAKSRGGAGA
ncbi:MAG TPA: tetratricopeptide repeat protein [Thermoanaerobaculia bacterium]